jgi:hypothetical protein
MKTGILGAGLMIAANVSAGAGVIDDLHNSYRSAGAAAFSEARGLALWQTQSTEGRTCATCHGQDLRQAGKHKTTQKPIGPMVRSANATRYTDAAKVEKWFLRNCKWTWGRECSAQEKGDLLQYLRSL